MNTSLPPQRQLSIVMADIGVAFGGSIVSGATLCNGLADLGHRVTLVTAMTTAEMQHVVSPKVNVLYLPQAMDYASWRDWVSARDRRQPQWLRRLLQYPEVVLQLILRNLPYSLRLASICRRVRADVLHANNGPDLPTAVAAVLCRRPLVMHLRGVHARSALNDLSVRLSDLFIAISQYTFDGCKAAGVPAKKTQVLMNPVEARRPDPNNIARVRLELGAQPTDFLIGSVGRVVGFKGQMELVKSLTPLLRTTKDLRLAIIGDAADGNAEYLASIKRWVDEQGLKQQVCFAGFRADIETVYAALDVMAHTSIYPEPFGRVIVEAMLQECAVVASAYGGPLEIITDGVDGVLLDPRNFDELRAGIKLLYDDRARTRQIAQAGAAMARARFGAAAYAKQMAQLYEGKCLSPVAITN